MRTLFLMPNSWDLTLDVDGNIATATSTYQQAQDVASECRLFQKDVYHDQSQGIPYLEDILGKGKYPLALYRRHLQDAARKVQGVVSADAKLQLRDDRLLGGQIVFTTDTDKTGSVDL